MTKTEKNIAKFVDSNYFESTFLFHQIKKKR